MVQVLEFGRAKEMKATVDQEERSSRAANNAKKWSGAGQAVNVREFEEDRYDVDRVTIDHITHDEENREFVLTSRKWTMAP